ncbi:hypothetical protein GCM10010327_58090 [Streptomyces nitrosporeus]|nr:hypothetical protein GCM10010327_58090 [Streptomyces nitrosporeus]
MRSRSSYPSDLSDARWERIRPALEAWRRDRAGIRRPTHDLRRLMDAILYVERTGIPWRYLPHDFPPWQSVYGYFARWRADGLLDRLDSLLRHESDRTEESHERAGAEEPREGADAEQFRERADAEESPLPVHTLHRERARASR